MSNNRFSSCGSRTTGGGCGEDQTIFYPCTEGLKGGIERTRFFDGMVLERSDLENNQAYWRTKRELTNRALGEGVVWGLRTEWDPHSRSFTLWPGYAIDCCGHDLLVSECHTTSARRLADPRNGIIAGLLDDLGRGETAKAHLVLRYVEQPEEARPVCATSCQPGQQDRYEYTRMRETTQLCLVPPVPEPPRGPVGKFIDELEALREALGDEQLEALFPGSGEIETEVPLYLILRIGGEQRVIAPYPEDGSWRWPNTPVAIVASRPPSAVDAPETTTIHLELRAGPGWALHHGSIELIPAAGTSGESGQPLAEVDAPLALELTWNLHVPAPSPAETAGPDDGIEAGSGRGIRARARNLGVARLFSPRERLLIDELTVQLDYQADPLRRKDAPAPEPDGTVLYQVSVQQVTAVADKTAGDPAPAARPDCFSPLAPGGIFIDQEGKTPTDLRPALLGALYAWLSGSLQGLDREAPDSRPWSGEGMLASWSYVVAWRLFYGANAVTPDFSKRESGRADLAHLLHCLLQRWCQGFLYPGPRCATEHQGVVLGTVELASGGRIVRFDPWDGRRHVLTGPLVGHWLGQLGIAPPDIIAGRLVRAICCVAQADAPIPKATPISSLAGIFPQNGAASVHWSDFGPGSIAISGGAHLLIGSDQDIADRLAARGRSVLRRDRVSALKFVTCLAAAFGNPSAPDPNTPLIQTVIAGQQGARLHLLVPASGTELADAATRAETLDREIRRILSKQREEFGDLGPLGEPALEDFMKVLARDLALPSSTNGPQRELIKALREAHRPSLGDALALGPERLRAELEELIGAEVDPSGLNQLWDSAITRLDLTAQLVRKGINSVFPPDTTPFSRRSLGDPELLDQLANILVLTTDGSTEYLVTRADLQAAAEETMSSIGP